MAGKTLPSTDQKNVSVMDILYARMPRGIEPRSSPRGAAAARKTMSSLGSMVSVLGGRPGVGVEGPVHQALGLAEALLLRLCSEDDGDDLASGVVLGRGAEAVSCLIEIAGLAAEKGVGRAAE